MVVAFRQCFFATPEVTNIVLHVLQIFMVFPFFPRNIQYRKRLIWTCFWLSLYPLYQRIFLENPPTIYPICPRHVIAQYMSIVILFQK